MIRPYFGQRATLDIPQMAESRSFNAYSVGATLFVESDVPQPIQIFNALGIRVFGPRATAYLRLADLPKGLYLVKVGTQKAQKVIVH